MSLREVEQLVIKATLTHTGGNIKETARILGIDRGTLYVKIKEYRIVR